MCVCLCVCVCACVCALSVQPIVEAVNVLGVIDVRVVDLRSLEAFDSGVHDASSVDDAQRKFPRLSRLTNEKRPVSFAL